MPQRLVENEYFRPTVLSEKWRLDGQFSELFQMLIRRCEVLASHVDQDQQRELRTSVRLIFRPASDDLNTIAQRIQPIELLGDGDQIKGRSDSDAARLDASRSFFLRFVQTPLLTDDVIGNGPCWVRGAKRPVEPKRRVIAAW